MATWAIGDVQGCWDALQRLLVAVAFDPQQDRLWLAGDMVNRGPQSLEVLRFCRDNADAVVAVLGNHDLHLLSRAAGVAVAGRRDTLDDVLAAADRDSLLAWLRAQPLLVRQGGFVMVHAGLWPSWSLAEAERAAELAGQALRGADAIAMLRGLRAADRWCEDATPQAQAIAAAAILTRIRCVGRDGGMLAHSGRLEDAPAHASPWWSLRRAARGSLADGDIVICGHWAALGLRQDADHWSLDTGCVWGRALTAVCLEDQRVVAVPTAADDGSASALSDAPTRWPS